MLILSDVIQYHITNICTTRCKYLCDDEPESKPSWISFERENCVKDVRGFRFEKILIDSQKYGRD